MRYIFNSAVITAPGKYHYQHLHLEDARAWIQAGPFRSTVRYRDTAAALAVLMRAPITIRDEVVRMQPGDEALVFRLVFPPGTKGIPTTAKGRLDADFILDHCEIGLMRRID
jgi:hypothetical protein